MMKPERWQQVERLYHAALDHAPSQRPEFLANACNGDPELLREVESLLALESRAGSFLEGRAMDVAAQVFAREEADSAESLTGQVMSHYRIVEKLGEGGMGLVYKAEDLKLGRLAALKFLAKAPFGSTDDAIMARMEREARAASALNHPNICTIYEIGEHQRRPFIAMELLEGKPLDRHIEETGPAPIRAVLEVAIQIAGALDAAHTRGILHRDIKPANIFLTETGRAKLLDFGLAKMQPAPDPAFSLTSPGVTPGTIAYMSPEQTRGDKLDARTDIFSLGCVLYEMATGQRAFSAPPSPACLRSDLPAELDRIITKALEKDRALRYQRASELRDDAQRLLRDLDSGQPLATTVRQRRRPLRAVALAAVAVLAIAAAWNVVGPRITPSFSGIDSLAVLPVESLSSDPAMEPFADGLTDELISDMARIGSLRVISRTSAMRYKGARKAMPEIARELRVDGIVEGSVNRYGDRIHLNIKLVHAPTDHQLWASSYDVATADAARWQQQVSIAVAGEISARVTAGGKPPLAGLKTPNPKAYEAYVRGRTLWNRRGAESITQAVSHFEQALREDPNFALAYSGLADCYTIGWGARLDVDLAEQYARKALALDPNLAEAHASLALAEQCQHRFGNVEKELKRAIELNPNYVPAYQFYTIYLLTVGEPQSALAQNDRALQVDPFSLPLNLMRALALIGLRQYDRAAIQLQTATEIEPQAPNPHDTLGRLFWAQGRALEAIAEERKMARLGHDTALFNAMDDVEAAYRRGGFRAACLASTQAMKRVRTSSSDVSWRITLRYANLQDRAMVLKRLAASLDEKGYDVVMMLKTGPELDFLRSDPAFQELLGRIGLVP